MNNIREYNNNLINNLTKITLIDYFNDIHSKFYSNYDISFMNYFLEIVDKDGEFCIEHIKLQEYKVINTVKSSDIKRCLEQFNLIENEDYRVSNVGHPVPQGGNSIKNEYLLTPNSFKLWLILLKYFFINYNFLK